MSFTQRPQRPDAAELYRALLNGRRLSGLRRLTYRCHAARCLLLEAVETPLGVIVHQKRWKFSDAENEARSNEAGRAANTIDGRNHWRERTYFLDSSALAYWEDVPSPTLGVSCDHVLDYQLRADEFHADYMNVTREVRIRADLSRYAL